MWYTGDPDSGRLSAAAHAVYPEALAWCSSPQGQKQSLAWSVSGTSQAAAGTHAGTGHAVWFHFATQPEKYACCTAGSRSGKYADHRQPASQRYRHIWPGESPHQFHYQCVRQSELCTVSGACHRCECSLILERKKEPRAFQGVRATIAPMPGTLWLWHHYTPKYQYCQFCFGKRSKSRNSFGKYTAVVPVFWAGSGNESDGHGWNDCLLHLSEPIDTGQLIPDPAAVKSICDCCTVLHSQHGFYAGTQHLFCQNRPWH